MRGEEGEEGGGWGERRRVLVNGSRQRVIVLPMLSTAPVIVSSDGCSPGTRNEDVDEGDR